jgi:hypothetical protein
VLVSRSRVLLVARVLLTAAARVIPVCAIFSASGCNLDGAV